jgi:hypothetical protein
LDRRSQNGDFVVYRRVLHDFFVSPERILVQRCIVLTTRTPGEARS